MPPWPPWWDWDLEYSPHLLKRMKDRGFTDTDLRDMLGTATGHRPGAASGRHVIITRHAGRQWEVVVEPDDADELLTVVTAYPIS